MKGKNEKILFVGFRDERHSSAGGYDQIIHFPDADYISDKMVPLSNIKVGQKGKFINLIFLEILAFFKHYNYRITHYFYGDTLMLPVIKSKKHKNVITIHLNIEENKRNSKLFFENLKRFDAIIVLSSNQKMILKDKFGIDSIFIPHGFNTPVFKQISSVINSSFINIFFSGTNYRDLNTLFKIIDFCSSKRKDIKFHVIGQTSSIKSSLTNKDNVICYNRICDDEYYSILSLCDYNFLPLTFATANNALLEAEFLGITSIIPSISGISDYAASSPLNIFYNSIEELENIFFSLTKRPSSYKLKKYATRFLWCNIYKQLANVYKQL